MDKYSDFDTQFVNGWWPLIDALNNEWFSKGDPPTIVTKNHLAMMSVEKKALFTKIVVCCQHQKKSFVEYCVENNIKHSDVFGTSWRYDKERVKELKDSYVKKRLKKQFDFKNPSPEITELKRTEIKLNRSINEKQRAINNS